jgi:hypothetical protein
MRKTLIVLLGVLTCLLALLLAPNLASSSTSTHAIATSVAGATSPNSITTTYWLSGYDTNWTSVGCNALTGVPNSDPEYAPMLQFSTTTFVHTNWSDWPHGIGVNGDCHTNYSLYQQNADVGWVRAGNSSSPGPYVGLFMPLGAYWVHCWAYGDYVNGWRIWDFLYMPDGQGRYIWGFYPDYYVNENTQAMAPQCVIGSGNRVQ